MLPCWVCVLALQFSSLFIWFSIIQTVLYYFISIFMINSSTDAACFVSITLLFSIVFGFLTDFSCTGKSALSFTFALLSVRPWLTWNRWWLTGWTFDFFIFQTRAVWFWFRCASLSILAMLAYGMLSVVLARGTAFSFANVNYLYKYLIKWKYFEETATSDVVQIKCGFSTKQDQNDVRLMNGLCVGVQGKNRLEDCSTFICCLEWKVSDLLAITFRYFQVESDDNNFSKL